MGVSRGHWDGDTLVIETTNFLKQADFMGLRNRFFGDGAHLRIIERFTRTDDRTIDYRLTVDEPTTWTQPWTVAIPLVMTDEPMFEYACHEGNYGMANLLSGARVKEKAAQEDK